MNIKKITAVSSLILAVLLTFFNLTVINREKKSDYSVNISAGRITAGLKEKIEKENIRAEQKDLIKTLTENSDFSIMIADSSLPLPESAEFIFAENTEIITAADSGYSTVISAVTDASGITAGFLIYRFRKPDIIPVIVTADCIILISFLTFFGTLIYLNRKLLKPFRRLQDYPEKIALGVTDTPLPESEKRNFGKLVWGMNMLRDRLATEKKAVSRLEQERQTLLTSIAHGVKTPVANIKLYAEAIQTGLYNGGVPSQRDAEIAEKISSNADDIRKLTAELLETASSAVFDYVPEISEFYLKEIADFIEDEYREKFKITRTSFTLSCRDNPLLHSDRNAVSQICVQLLENALKYGDGKSVKVNLRAEDDYAEISVTNSGKLLSEAEMPFVFNSFWRGSNAANTEGNGIGLYISSRTARHLGGEIFPLRHPETNEMEFSVIIPI